MTRTLFLGLIFAAGAAFGQTTLIPDRLAPETYPTLDLTIDQGGPLDGADPAAALETAAADAERRALYAALVPLGCRLAERDVERVLAPEGFSFDFVNETMTGLIVEGVARIDAEGHLQLPAAICPPSDPAPTPRQRVLDVFRAAGCTISEADLLAAVPGVARTQLLAIAGPMVERGEMTVDGLNATLEPPLCEAGG